MPKGTLRVPASERDAERPGLHSFAARGNDHVPGINIERRTATKVCSLYPRIHRSQETLTCLTP
ncbi:hypothetical protein DM828_09195 [Pseudomonas umsongensis]|nr:hypothetical protein [Pseudomonas umsongensis]